MLRARPIVSPRYRTKGHCTRYFVSYISRDTFLHNADDMQVELQRPLSFILVTDRVRGIKTLRVTALIAFYSSSTSESASVALLPLLEIPLWFDSSEIPCEWRVPLREGCESEKLDERKDRERASERERERERERGGGEAAGGTYPA